MGLISFSAAAAAAGGAAGLVAGGAGGLDAVVAGEDADTVVVVGGLVENCATVTAGADMAGRWFIDTAATAL